MNHIVRIQRTHKDTQNKSQQMFKILKFKITKQHCNHILGISLTKNPKIDLNRQLQKLFKIRQFLTQKIILFLPGKKLEQLTNKLSRDNQSS